MELLFIQPLHELLSFLGFKRQAASKSPVIREDHFVGNSGRESLAKSFLTQLTPRSC